MAVHDTIGDYLTTIRNASNARKASCVVRFSKMRAGIAAILKQEGYISDFSEITEDGARYIKLELKYVDEQPAIVGISRRSRPGRRVYVRSTDIPRVLGGLGTAILTTSRGVIHDREARRLNVGGEIICNIW